ncbi:MAG: methyltransferase [Myxococcales bacterium]|nr:methyltransferase [Myxococcales bacterium]
MTTAHPPPLTGATLRARWEEAAPWVAGLRDVIDERPAAQVPGWAQRRGWAEWLLGVDDGWLAQAEAQGAWALPAPPGAPPDLLDLWQALHRLSALPPLLAETPQAQAQRGVKARKRAQLAAFGQLAAPLAGRVHRVVDVGAGHGHLTRELAQALAVDGLGLEREVRFVEAAAGFAPANDGSVRFQALTLTADGPSPVQPQDLVVGLHACGALTDTLTEHAARAGAPALWVSCCLHKVPGETRAPRCCPAHVAAAALTLPRDRLGLANLTQGAPGVEASLPENLAARARRVGLWVLLRDRGEAVPEPGDAMRGLNRRLAHRPFAELAAAALAGRGLAAATPAELAAAEAEGARLFAAERRFTLARRPIGRLLEVFINLERAVWLMDRGYTAELGLAWPLAVSPRNVMGRAWPTE